jgi:hypothetical protein
MMEPIQGSPPQELKVKIHSALRRTKTDTRWFDAYVENQKKDYILRYWSSDPFASDDASWEHLVEGAISAVDPSQIDHIRKHGGHLALMRQPAAHP